LPVPCLALFLFHQPPPSVIYSLSLHDALPIYDFFFHHNIYFFSRFKLINSLWFDIAVTCHTCTSWDNLTDDNIFFKTKKMIFLTTYSGICKNTSCFLE